jgi:mannitol-1-/sugar-/sorbitol-6-/2-deoxyglucose-6-phosphatase
MEIKAVIFDMDGLLIDSEPLWHEAEMLTFRTVGINLTKQDCLKTTGLRVDEVVKYWYQQYPWPSPPPEMIEEAIVIKLIELIGSKGEAKEGVSQAIKFVRSLDVKIALASSSNYRIINTVMEKLNLREIFQVIYSAEEEQYGKPHPGVYISTAKRLQVLPQECLAIEDSLTGVLAAKSARMRCIAIPEPVFQHEKRFIIADLVLKSLNEIDSQSWQQLI